MAHSLAPDNPSALYLYGSILFARFQQVQVPSVLFRLLPRAHIDAEKDVSLLLMAGMKFKRAVRLKEIKSYADLLWTCGQRLIENAQEAPQRDASGQEVHITTIFRYLRLVKHTRWVGRCPLSVESSKRQLSKWSPALTSRPRHSKKLLFIIFISILNRIFRCRRLRAPTLRLVVCCRPIRTCATRKPCGRAIVRSRPLQRLNLFYYFT